MATEDRWHQEVIAATARSNDIAVTRPLYNHDMHGFICLSYRTVDVK